MYVCRAVKSGYIATFFFFRQKQLNFKKALREQHPTVRVNSDLWTLRKQKLYNWALECKCWFSFLLLFIYLFLV